MQWVLLAGILFILLFSFVIFFGAPFLPTLSNRSADALELAGLKAGQTLLELGCGDGRILKKAAQKGIKGIGYELNPLLVVWAKLRTWPERRLVTIKLANFWTVKWPPSDAIYVFLLNPYMIKLDKKIIQYKHKPVKLVSFAFQIPAKKPAKEKSGMYLYLYK